MKLFIYLKSLGISDFTVNIKLTSSPSSPIKIKHKSKMVVLHKVVMTLKNLLGLKDLAGLPLLYAGLPSKITC
jgi:hypothetical protein